MRSWSVSVVLLLVSSTAFADRLREERISVPAETCVQISGTAVTRAGDGFSSGSAFVVRCPLEFVHDSTYADSEIETLEGFATGCVDPEFGGERLTISVRRRARGVNSSASTLGYCNISSGYDECSDTVINHDVANDYYYWLEFNSLGGVPCEVAGATVTYSWWDDV